MSLPGFAAISGSAAPPLPPPPYAGPLDLTAATPLFGYSVRALANAKIGSNLATLRRDSDNATLSFVALANGKFDQASAATWYGGANPYLKSWIDQGPSGLDTLSTNVVDAANGSWPGEDAEQPKYVPNAFTGLPTFDSAGNTDPARHGWTETQSNVSLAGGQITVFAVATNTGNSGIFAWDVADTSTPGSYFHELPPSNLGVEINASGPVNKVYWSAGVSPTYTRSIDTYTNDGTAVGTFCYYEFTFTGTAGDPSVMNTSTPTAAFSTLNDAPDTGTSWPVVLFTGGLSALLAGMMNGTGNKICEIVTFAGTLSSGDRDAIRQNIGTFYGISVAP